jgi:drug/metabolite transporter (DMT)-like permease
VSIQEVVSCTPRAMTPSWPGARLEGLLWAALSVVIFSGWFVVTRFSVTHELQVWDVTALRFGAGAVLLSPAVLRRGSRLPMSAWGEGLLFALLWGAPFVLLVALGLKLTSAAQAASIAPTTMPLVAGILSFVLLRERQGWIRWSGYAAILAGLVSSQESSREIRRPVLSALRRWPRQVACGLSIHCCFAVAAFRRSGLRRSSASGRRLSFYQPMSSSVSAISNARPRAR